MKQPDSFVASVHGWLRLLARADTRREGLRIGLRTATIGMGLGVVPGAIIAAGQITGAGLYGAASSFGVYWALSPVLGVVAVVVFVVFFVFVELFFSVVGWVFSLPMRLLGRTGGSVGRWLKENLSYFGLLPVVFFLFVGGVNAGRKTRAGVESVDEEAISQTREAVGRQREATQQLSSGAEQLIVQMDSTLNQLRESRESLRGMLVRFEQQRSAVDNAERDLSGILDEYRRLQLRNEEMKRLLDGERPATLRDVSRFDWAGLLIGGVVVALFVNVAASEVHRRILDFVSRRRKKEEGGNEPGGLPHVGSMPRTQSASHIGPSEGKRPADRKGRKGGKGR